MLRKICVISGSRADYGLLRFVLQEIEKNSELDLQIIATGMHLSETYGWTYREIEEDGYVINHKVKCLTSSDSALDISEAVAKCIQGCSKALDDLKPDIVLVLGDRFEIFSAAIASLIGGVPIAHIHGGETTLGSYDESFRHAITKMSSIHFVTTKEYQNRVIQLGENPKNVYLVGGLGVDVIKKSDLFNKSQIEEIFGFTFNQKSLLITFHPETLSEDSSFLQMNELILALAELEDTTLIFTSPNADSGNLAIIELINNFALLNPNVHFFKSLGQRLYLSCMSIVDGVIGNSSSGITETPSFKVGTINIGKRQHGRIQANNIINCDAKLVDIRRALEKLFSSDFCSTLLTCESPYGDGGASQKISNILSSASLIGIKVKLFYDIN